MKIRIIVTEDTIDIGAAWPDNPQAKFYPKLDVNLDPKKTKWIESARTNNLYLEGWGGDFDGDMISNKGLFSQEANEELDDIIKNKIHYYVDPSGGPSRQIGKELIQTLYNFTCAY